MIPQINGGFIETGEYAAIPEKILAWGKKALLDVFFSRMQSMEQDTAPGLVFMGEGKPADSDPQDAFWIVLCLKEDKSLKEGAYELVVDSRGARIYASKECGLAYGLTTLFLMIRDGGGQICCGRCSDVPAHVYRGFLLDDSRHFFGTDTVKSMIEQAALRKMNRLHWHLSDDQGYRLESRVFPKLNETGSFRDDPLSGPHYGGFYTNEEVKDIISYAGARGVEVVPEIDMPGHVLSILAAYPELSCSKKPVQPAVSTGIFSQILCAGDDRVLEFVKKLLDEVCSLFPYDYVHIGGDEVPKKEWKACSRCRERMKQFGLKNEEELQAWFTGQVVSYLIEKGKKPVCWNDALKSGRLDARAVIQYWEEEQETYCSRELSSDRQWIYSYTPAFYFDYSPALCPMRKVMSAQPVLSGGERIPEEKLQGYECTLWSEHIFDRERLEYLSFPRMYAVAELGWNGQTEDSFRQRCEKEIEAAQKQGIHAGSYEESDPDKQQQKAAILKEWKTRLESASFLEGGDVRSIIYQTIRSKLQGEMPQKEIEELIQEIDA